ncbi:MAG: substrate-binding domain-containing protein [Actinobacteria bacterium]|nr:substrate-binding domain-containing protein [Actinomycetota bacterium]
MHIGRRAGSARIVALGAAVSLSVAALAACSARAGAGGSTGSATTAAERACVSSAKQIVKKGTAAPSFGYTPIKGGISSLRGKSAWVLGPTVASPLVQGIGQGVQQGLAAAGVKVHVVDAETTNDDNTAMNQAIAGHASLIIPIAVATDSIDSALKSAASAHIPVLSLYEKPTSATAKAAVKGVLSVDTSYVSKLMGAYVLANTGCQTSTGFLYAPPFAVHKDILSGMKGLFQQLCPSTCSVVGQAYDPTKANTTVGPLAVSMAERNPSMNAMIFPTDDPLATVAVPALNAAGKTMVGVGEGGSPAPLKMIADNTMFKSDVTLSSPVLTGWTAADSGLRLMLGQPMAATDVLSYRLLSAGALPSGGNYFPSVGDFQARFKDAWTGKK